MIHYRKYRKEKQFVPLCGETYVIATRRRAANTQTPKDRVLIPPRCLPRQEHVLVEGSRSTVSYTANTELDYGTLLCWGINSVGQQRKPCVFHVFPAGGCPSVLQRKMLGPHESMSLFP